MAFLSTLLSVSIVLSVLGLGHSYYDEWVDEPEDPEQDCVQWGRSNEYCRTEDGIQMFNRCEQKKFLVVRCEHPKSKCVEYYDDDTESTTAECLNPTVKPAFPPKGIITWTGTEKFDYTGPFYTKGGEHERTANVYGMAWKDSDGLFYYRERKVHKWPGMEDNKKYKEPAILKTEFMIIKPDGDGGYFKYEGRELDELTRFDDRKQQCTKSYAWKEGSLTSVWENFKRWSKYKLEDQSDVSDGVESQSWVDKIMAEEWSSEYTFNVDYSKNDGYAVPTSSKLLYKGVWTGTEITEKEYHYSNIIDDNVKFGIPEFCN